LIGALELTTRSSRRACIRVLIVIAFLFGPALGQQALAQAPSASRPNHWEWVVAAYLGSAHTGDSKLIVNQPGLGTNLTFDSIGLRGNSFDGPLYYGLRAGIFTRRVPALGLEAEFIHLKVFSSPEQRVLVSGTHLGNPVDREQALGDTVQRYSISHGVNLLLFNVAGRYRIKGDSQGGRSRFILTSRFGVGPTLPHTESSVDGFQQEQYEVGALALQLGGGAEARLKAGLYLLGEYKFTRTRQTGKIFSGEAESLLRTQHGVFGLSYHF
jgi:hypothetical protein